MIMKNIVSNELINQVFRLTQALNSAKSIATIIDQENENLKQALLLLSNKHITEDSSNIVSIG